MYLPTFRTSATKLIAERYSCRAFSPSDEATYEAFDSLRSFVSAIGGGPLGGRPRFELIASAPGDGSALKGLGTYGFIKDPSAFLAVIKPKGVEALDVGWGTESAVLKATELGLGSCWLGGTFRRGRFAKAAGLARGEALAIVVALGQPTPDSREGALRRKIAGDKRKPWAEIFFEGRLETPIASPEALVALGMAPDWATVLEALRLSPSASNKQPWALAKTAKAWELYLRRDPGYYSAVMKRLGIMDMQPNDIGIAMLHFALAAREAGLPGEWKAESGAREPSARLRSEEEAAPLLAASFAIA
jgi:nitroreductase